MQRRTQILLTAVLAGSLRVVANDIEPTKERYTAPFTLTKIELDGKLNEWGGASVIADPRFAVPKGSGSSANPKYVLFEEYNGGTWTGPEDQTSAVQVVYDADNVYFGFVVTDDYHENAANSAWNGDSVQLMIANGDRNKQVALYNYALGGVEGSTGDVVVMHEAGPGGTEAVVTRDAATKKTVYEIKLPKAALELTALTPGTKFGLGMAINDGDEATPGQKGWGGLGAHSIVFGKTPSETALVTLGANVTTVEILGTGAESLLGGDATDPENDGNEDAGPADPSWNWVSISANIEPAFGGGENSFNIFDNKVGGGNDKWCCDDPTPAKPYWVAVEFRQPLSLTHFTVTSGNDTPTRDPTDWQIQGSQDGINYSPIYVFKSATVPWDARNQVVKFTLPLPSVAFRHIRYIVYDTPGTLHQLNEIEYFGTYGGSAVAFLSAINPSIGSFGFRVNDNGASVVDPATVKLTIDGAAVSLGTLTKTAGAINVSYTPARQFLPGTKHTYAITAKDGLGNVLNSAAEWTTPNYALLTAEDKVTPNTARPGFIWNVHQNNAFGANNNIRPQEQLAGKLGLNMADPAAQGSALGAGVPSADKNGPIQFEIETVINLDQAGGGNGSAQPDDQMPGIPGTEGGTDGIAGEILTFIDLPAGKTTLIVNSDDGFVTWAGNVYDVFDRQTAGEFSGGRGAADTAYDIYVEAAGVYPFRTIWQEGGGGANIEWLVLKSDGTKVLINDTANGGPKAYRVATGGTLTAATSVSPAPGANSVAPDDNIEVVISEGATAVDTTKVTLSLDGATVTPTVTRNGKTVTVSYNPPTDFSSPSTHKAVIGFAGRTEEWSFTIPPLTKDKTSGKVAFLVAGAKFSADKGGRSGAAGDYSLDTGGATGTAYVPNIAFFNAATADDTLSVAYFQKLNATRDASGFWANSPSSNNGTRGFQAHSPWSNGNIYFDTAGCCTADGQRINADIATFADYTDATWWNGWHHFAFVKDTTTKRIYIDGKLFHEGGGNDPLPTDFTNMVIGGGPATGDNRTNGFLDDFAVYNGALTEAQAKSLAGGAAASSVAGLLAHWDFNDIPVESVMVKAVRNGNKVDITSVPAALPAGWVLQTSPSATGPWTTQAGAKTPITVTIGAGNSFLRAAKP